MQHGLFLERIDGMLAKTYHAFPRGISIDAYRRRIGAISCNPPYDSRQEAEAALAAELDPEGGTFSSSIALSS